MEKRGNILGLSYYLYSPDTGELLSNEKYVGFDIFCDSNTHHLGKTCVIHQDKYLEHIDKWTIDESDELWQEYFSQDVMMMDETQCCSYFTRAEIFELQRVMRVNKELLIEIMGEHNGLIVQIW